MAPRADDDRQPPQDLETPDGKQLLLVDRGIPPDDYDNQIFAIQRPWTEVVLWLLNAAASGVVGDLAYGALKRTIDRARAMHHSSIWPLWRQHSDGQAKGEVRMEPSDELRDELIKIAHDTLRRFRHISPSKGRNLWSKAEVTLSDRGTWKVGVREVGADGYVVVEIDLAGMANERDDREGFPVTIWY